MKNIMILLAIILLVFFTCTKKNQQSELNTKQVEIINKQPENNEFNSFESDYKYKWIAGEDGLKLRSQPDNSSDEIIIIPKGEKVIFLKEAEGEIIINNYIGKWSKVKWNDNQGWVFGGYLAEDDTLDISKNEFVLEGDEQSRISNFIMYGFPIETNMSILEIINIFGEPDNIEKEETTNQYTGKTDYINKIYYEDKYFEIYHVTESDKYITLIVKLSSDKYQCKYGIQVGQSSDKLIEIFGKPSEIKGDNYIYSGELGELCTVPLTFIIIDNKISEIIWWKPLC